MEKYRLNKYVAHCGLCSRRKAGDWVKEGRVKVNGEVVKDPSVLVDDSDTIEYQDEVIKRETKKVYLLMNKPKRTITSLSDEKDRKTVIDLLSADITERVYPVGRLDYMTTGLLVLTNDGDLALKLAHPSYEIKKVYHASLDKDLNPKHLEQIIKGFELEDGWIKVDHAAYVKGNRQEIGVELHSGRNRIVRRIFEHFGYRVVGLDRVLYGGLTKKNIGRGRYRHLKNKEVIFLKHF